MNTNNTSSAAWRSFKRIYWIVAIALALLLLLSWLLGYGPGGSACKAPVAVNRSSVPAVVAGAPKTIVTAPAPGPATTPPTAAAPAATPAPAAATAAAPSAAAATPRAAPPAPSAKGAAVPADAPPAAKLYFGLDKTSLPRDAKTTLQPIVAYLKSHAGAKALVSGYHDPSGQKAHNEELALNRAREARAALESAGIARDRIVMEKPQETTGTGEPREARRVEVSIQGP